MAKCNICNYVGSNMKRCTECGMMWCQRCATTGKWPGPRQTSVNVCPYCGRNNRIETMR